MGLRDRARAIWLATLLAGLVLPACAPSAHAGTYTVYGCSKPNGSPAPIDGWASAVDAGGQGYVAVGDACSGTSPYFAMEHFLPAGQASWTWSTNAYAQWTFGRPPTHSSRR